MKDDIFDNLGLSHSQAAEVSMRADVVLDAILKVIERRRLTRTQLCKILDEYQPNVSLPMRVKISRISLDKLERYADRLGIQFEVTALKAKKRSREIPYA